jgi:integrase
VTHQGVKCFYVDEKAAKTGAGIRYVPVADEVKHIALFKRNANALGKKFGRTKAKIVGDDRTKVFHSIRKNVTTLLERGGISEGVAADLIGHEKKTMTYGVYSGGSSIQQLQEAVSVIRQGNADNLMV